VGVLANPASGRDIRRLTAHASVFPTAEKANMVVRLLAGMGALGIQRVLMLRDRTGVAGLVMRAFESHSATAQHERWPEIEFVDLPITESVADTHIGVQYMVSQNVSLIAVLGGDGTHRAVAAYCARTPLLALSTGTNNAFPEMREATVAGMAGALVATRKIPTDLGLTRNKRLVAHCIEGPNCGREEIALVDICATRQTFIGARAISDTSDIDSLFLAFATVGSMGLASIGSAWQPVERHDNHGLYITCGDGPQILAPIAPGRIDRVCVHDWKKISIGQTLEIRLTRGTLAFDGEREIELAAGDRYQVQLDWGGPLTVDVENTLRYAAAHDLFRSDTATQGDVACTNSTLTN
jgi:predicted polyphosphate/ATP-dependent NAD kinase